MRPNAVKQLFRQRKPALTAWCSVGNPYSAETLGHAGFDAVVDACAASSAGREDSWINAPIRRLYVALNARGQAHSIECWQDERLVGGLYGVTLGGAFFGESMFSGRSGGSKVALATLAARLHGWGWPLIDAQVENDHLVSLGAVRMPRHRFLAEVAALVDPPAPAGPWTPQFGRMTAAELAQASVP